MFLKKMEVNGFKSFAKPTTIKFTDGLIVVVGPNGSGKSNINDAFKWVLGETSKKSLRAKNSIDMIFSGSDDKKPSSFAEVSLFFDNKKRILNIDKNEVIISRKSFRNGSPSQYFINKVLSKRKDIKKLFLGTGLGNIDLSIISQGSVTKITESKPSDLKQLLNEATGVSKYEVQKNESLRKLEKLDQTLELFSVKFREMERRITPLKKKKEIAEKYLSIREELLKIELPIINQNIFKNIELEKKYNKEIENSISIKEFANEHISKIQSQIKKFQEEIMSLDDELLDLQQKQSEFQSQAMAGEFDQENFKKNIEQLLVSIKEVQNIEKRATEKKNSLSNSLKQLNSDQFYLSNEKNNISKKINQAEYEIQKNSKSRGGYVSRGVRSIIDNKKMFNEVYGIINDLIRFNKKYETAILNSIGSKLNNIVVSDENVIKEAISFLKSNRLGTATFVPASKVKPRKIPIDYEKAIDNFEGYIGTIASLIKTETRFRNVVKSIGGTTLVFDNIENALKGAKLLGYRYEIVTIEGDQIYPGFTVKGGSNIQGGKLNELKKQHKNLQLIYETTNAKLNNKLEEIETVRKLLSITSTELIRAHERIQYLNLNLDKMLVQYKNMTGKKFNIKNFEDNYIYDESTISIEEINNRLKIIQSQKQELHKEVILKQEEEHDLRNKWDESTTIQSKTTRLLNEIKTEIIKDKEILNVDYKMTLDNLKAAEIPKLEMNFKEASDLRIKLRKEINKLGYIDFEAVQSYDELYEEYETLRLEVEDLRNSKQKLSSTIELMDNQMIIQFKEIFDKVNERFNSVFSSLFRGGSAEINYTNPDNILETGIVINAKMPNKTIKSISLYSGGEKSLISLALIFAINEVRNLPILMLDEVEAALDEANVERFAKFAKLLNEKTQIIITSHRLGTMEQADVLYGVTMQTKGITDIVSVRLKDAITMVD